MKPLPLVLPRALALATLSIVGLLSPLHAALDTNLPLPPTISPDAKVEKLAALPKESYTIGQPFTEGTTTAPNGDVYFVEQNSNKIMRWDVAAKELSVFMHPAG